MTQDSADVLAILQQGSQQTFWRRFTVNANGCWIWTGARNGRGYGVIRWRGKLVLTHRLAWRLYHRKPIPPGKLILHDLSCSSRACGCPDHTKPGSPSRNMYDRWAKKKTHTIL